MDKTSFNKLLCSTKNKFSALQSHSFTQDGWILLAGIFLGIFLHWKVVSILLFLVLIWTILGHIQNRTLAFFAFFFLILTAFLLTFGYKESSESAAIFSFSFFAMMTLRMLMDTWGMAVEK